MPVTFFCWVFSPDSEVFRYDSKQNVVKCPSDLNHRQGRTPMQSAAVCLLACCHLCPWCPPWSHLCLPGQVPPPAPGSVGSLSPFLCCVYPDPSPGRHEDMESPVCYMTS